MLDRQQDSVHAINASEANKQTLYTGTNQCQYNLSTRARCACSKTVTRPCNTRVKTVHAAIKSKKALRPKGVCLTAHKIPRRQIQSHREHTDRQRAW